MGQQNNQNLLVAYYRVSTEEQGKSGLGLEAQKESVENYSNKFSKTILKSFQDIQSGKDNNREGLNKAIQLCKLSGATLIVKNLSRVSRSGFKLLVELDEANVNFIESESPNDSQVVKEIKMSLAKDEVSKISERTKSALSQIKKAIRTKGYYMTKDGNIITSLGKPTNLSQEGVLKSAQVRKVKAISNENNRKAYAYIKLLYDKGISFRSMVDMLNSNGFKTSKGKEFVSNVQVSRIFNMYNQKESV